MGCGVGDPPNEKTFIEKNVLLLSLKCEDKMYSYSHYSSRFSLPPQWNNLEQSENGVLSCAACYLFLAGIMIYQTA